MNKRLRATLLMAEANFGAITKFVEAKEAVSIAKTKLSGALDVLTGASPESVIPEGYIQIPIKLSSHETRVLAKKLQCTPQVAETAYKSLIELVT